MNAKTANAIPLSEILALLGHRPVPRKSRGHDLWYFSPFREEKTPSFHIHSGKNVWYDFGEGKGGTVIDFVCAWLQRSREDHTVVDALRWLDNMQPGAQPAKKSRKPETAPDPKLTLQRVEPLKSAFLLDYLAARGIPAAMAKRWTEEAHLLNTESNRITRAIAFHNEDGGYELRNEFWQGCIRSKYVSVLRGKVYPPQEVHLFEGFMDYLSALAFYGAEQFEGDVIVLNSVALVQLALNGFLYGYPYKSAYTWFDNDVAGKKATQAVQDFAKAQGNPAIFTMNHLYAGHKDVNDWHMHRRGL